MSVSVEFAVPPGNIDAFATNATEYGVLFTIIFTVVFPAVPFPVIVTAVLLPFAVACGWPTLASAIVSFDAVFDTVASITNPPEPDVDAGVLDTLIIPLLIVTSYF